MTDPPYDLEARSTRRGHRTWVGSLAHTTETCDEGSTNVITDVATTVPTGDSVALPGIHTRLKRRRLLPAEHLVDSGCTSVVLHDTAARAPRVTMVGPVKTDNSRQRKTGDGFARENFIIDFDRREVTCPNGQASGNRNELPAMAPYTVVRFDTRHCGPCPERSSCTSGAARTVNFLPRRLHEFQGRNRADQQDPQGQRLCASRSGVEGTMNELVNGHRMRRCRYHGVAKAHVQHALTAIAVTIERFSAQEPEDAAYRPPFTDGVPAVPRRQRIAPAPLVAPRTMIKNAKGPRQNQAQPHRSGARRVWCSPRRCTCLQPSTSAWQVERAIGAATGRTCLRC
ncbi:transposase [Streptomyces sp. NPDC050388]|uniref:transposase n=1 Tax=Streptomyces sp. NPDC050388 TaxID=3155781 RepID=UPI00343DB5FF